jgi:hypothetical protein
MASCVIASCTQVMGPTRSYARYEEKAAATADAVLSAVRTASLVAEGAVDGDLFGPYTSVVLSEAEAAAAGAQSTFDGIQPPDGRSDALRDDLGRLLDRAVDELTDLRIEARRSQTAGLGAHGPALARIADDLEAFSERHQ